MSERDLYRQVARATGETVTAIADMGFVPLSQHVDDDEHLAIDWDRLQDQRMVSVMPTRNERSVLQN